MTLPSSPPTFVHRATVEFAYPYDTPTTMILLPSPAFGNQETMSQMRIITETRGGDLVSFRDATWPKDDEGTYTFTNLKENQKKALETFIERTLGKEFKFTDHNSLVWKAIITSPDCEFVQDAHERYTVNLTLDLRLMSWP